MFKFSENIKNPSSCITNLRDAMFQSCSMKKYLCYSPDYSADLIPPVDVKQICDFQQKGICLGIDETQKIHEKQIIHHNGLGIIGAKCVRSISSDTIVENCISENEEYTSLVSKKFNGCRTVTFAN